jgi:hypothetical protein
VVAAVAGSLWQLQVLGLAGNAGELPQRHMCPYTDIRVYSALAQRHTTIVSSEDACEDLHCAVSDSSTARYLCVL